MGAMNARAVPGCDIRMEGVRFSYAGPRGAVVVLDGIDLMHREGMLAIVGPSGSGKSTILRLLSGMAVPDTGRIAVGGMGLTELPARRRERFRRERIGFVFQGAALLDHLSASENVLLPIRASGVARDVHVRRTHALLEALGVASRAEHAPDGLSGGERQRVGIARALVHDPPLVLADEPTGDLDLSATETVAGILRDIADRGRTVVVATHDPRVAARADTILDLGAACTTVGHGTPPH